jgi:exodeoxyribonuclease VII large subunit
MPWNEEGWTPVSGEILSVSDLLGRSRRVLEHSLTDVWVEGEVCGLKIPASGHAYFSLGDGACQIRAVCFRSALRLLPHAPREGMAVLIRGRMTVYEARGDLQLVVEHMEPQGEGLLRLQLEALKRKLAAEGLFDPARKRPLPVMPRAVAVVTSSTGAAVRDILQVLGRRAPWVDVYVCHSRVQGEGAAAELAEALKLACGVEEVDTVIIGRGGGAAEDLSAFNDERLVRLVAACPKPVISAVGHEIDVTLVDFAADMRAPTPSAAAELAVREAAQWVTLLQKAENSLAAEMRHRESQLRKRLSRLDLTRFEPRRRIERQRIGVDRAVENLTSAMDRRLWAAHRRLAEAERGLVRESPSERAADAKMRLSGLALRLDAAARSATLHARHRASLAAEGLSRLSPLAVLARGYSVVRDAEGRAVRDAAALQIGQRVDVLLHRGGFEGEVKKLRKG